MSDVKKQDVINLNLMTSDIKNWFFRQFCFKNYGKHACDIKEQSDIDIWHHDINIWHSNLDIWRHKHDFRKFLKAKFSEKSIFDRDSQK